MIIPEEVAIEETCRQMSIKLVDSCYVILPDHLVLHRQCISLEFLNIYIDNFGKLLLSATTAVLSAILMWLFHCGKPQLQPASTL